MTTRRYDAIYNHNDTFETARITFWPDKLVTDKVPVILGWSADSVAIKLVPEAEWRKEAIANTETPRFIEQVERTVRGRRDNYGRPLLNFLRIAIKWTEHLHNVGMMIDDAFVSPVDVAWMMVDLKAARAEHSWTDDSVLDAMGYEDCLDDMNRHMKDMGWKEGVEAFKTMPYLTLLSLRDQLVAERPIDNP